MKPRPQDIPQLCRHWLRDAAGRGTLAERVREALRALAEIAGASGACLVSPAGVGLVASGDLDEDGSAELADGPDAVQRRQGAVVVRRGGELGAFRVSLALRFPEGDFREAEDSALVSAAAAAFLQLLAPSAPGREETFAGYELLALLGEGGMGQIHLARPRGGGERVALKRIWRHLARDRQFLQMFSREVQTASLISHPNVVRILEYGVEGGEAYLAMEYLRGGSFAKLCAGARAISRPLPLGMALALVLDWAAGLAAVHERGLVHCDVSPQNLFVTSGGQGKLIDFGMARKVSTSREAEERARGTLGYVAPEQVLGPGFDHRADLFALGMVLYEQLGGEVPTSMRSYVQRSLPPLSPRAASARRVAQEVDRAVCFEPSARHASAAALSSALRAAAAEDGLHLAQPEEIAVVMRDALGGLDAELQRLGSGRTSGEVAPNAKTAALE